MTIYKKLNEARKKFHSLEMKKSGRNDFAKYNYFELSDFIKPILTIFDELGLCGVVSFDKDIATLRIIDTETSETFSITSPMGSAALKGCHEVQNIGAVETYQRRYLWMAAFEIIEQDAVDASTGKEPPSIDPYIKQIMSALSEDALKKVYIAAVKTLGELPELVKAKDIRKAELLGAQS